MNYVWDLVIKAERSGISRDNICFVPAKVYSPYMELCTENLNNGLIEKKVEVNPNYRFYEIFKDMFHLNNNEDEEIRYELFDILMHFLTEIDLNQGMNKREYYEKFILEDLENGIFGEEVKEKIRFFNLEEKYLIAQNILDLYTTGQTMYILKNIVKSIFKNSIIYSNTDEKEELIFYIGEEKNEVIEKKLNLLIILFLPIKYQLEIYYENHFGIIDIDETMRIDQIALY
jgi:hypothetical protein